MKREEHTEKKLYIPPDFYVLKFMETQGGNNDEDYEDSQYDTNSGPEA